MTPQIHKPTPRTLGVCEWRYDDTEGKWDASCGHAQILIDGTPSENHYNYRPNCGRVLEVSE